MGREKSKRTGYGLSLEAILLVACLVLAVGAAWARFQEMTTQELGYATKEYATVYLWGVDEAGIVSETQSNWQTKENYKSLAFCVTNGLNEAEYSAEPQQVYVRLCASSGIQGSIETMAVVLYLPQTGETYSGTPQKIAEGSPLYASFGSGWVFTFRDEDGEELSWTLEGGALSVLYTEIQLQNVKLDDLALLQLQVSGDMAVS